MLLGSKFQAFMDASPVSVMIRGTLERILHPDRLEQAFVDHAVSQYTLKITFAQCVQIMDAVVFKLEPSVGAWYQNHGHTLSATRQALYDKLKHVEPAVSAVLVHQAGAELLSCVRNMKQAPKAPLPGYRVRVLDGNHLTGTEHRLKGLRGTRAAALPGQALVLYDPRFDLITDAIPCEDAYSQERSLLDQVLPLIVREDCVVADRNFCTTGFLFGLWQRAGCFVIRQHASTLTWKGIGKARRAGKGEKELYVLTNLPAKRAAACLVADLYARRWTIEICHPDYRSSASLYLGNAAA
jgi:Transposase DDE domain